MYFCCNPDYMRYMAYYQMKKVNIVYLAHRRMEFSNLLFLILNKCTFKDFHITICSMGCAKDRAENVYKNAIDYGFEASLFITNEAELNYLDKVKTCANYDYEYSIKLDEDIFFGSQVWDYLFNNLDILNDSNNLILSVALSSGIPTIDQFIKYNFTIEQQDEIKKMFSDTVINTAWGVDYSSLNKALVNRYDSDTFFEAVNNFQHYYKGIHPVRVNFSVQDKINNNIKTNIDRFFEQKEFIIEELKRPYFCNSVFAIKTKQWKEILDNNNLFVDNFDEVSLNKYRENNNKKFLYIVNAFGIHTLYNTLWEYNDMDTINKNEEAFYNFLLENVKNKLS